MFCSPLRLRYWLHVLLFKEHEWLGLVGTASRRVFWRSRYCVALKEASRGFGQGRRISQKGLENVKRGWLIDGILFYNRFKARIQLLKYVDELKFAWKPIIRRQLGLVFFYARLLRVTLCPSPSESGPLVRYTAYAYVSAGPSPSLLFR